MSGSTGADRIQTRKHFKKFLDSYEKIIKAFPGFVSITPSGSYNSNPNKTEFGDIDLITHIKSDKDKATVKKELAAHLEKLPDSVIVPFGSDKYKGKKSLNTGEIVTIRYHDKELGYSVQIDNIIALDETEATFKKKFLDFAAEKQGLILGLIKVATIENPLDKLFKKLHISVPLVLPTDEEYEFNLSSIELQLRHVIYEPGTLKQKSRSVVWTSRNFDDIKKILWQYNLESPFDELLLQVKKKLKNPRSKNRIRGVFSSMISVKSGEIGTPKGDEKTKALQKIIRVLGESYIIGFKDFLTETSTKTVVYTFGRFQGLSKGHELLIQVVEKTAKANSADSVIYVSKTQDKKKNPLTAAQKIHYLNIISPNTNFKAAGGEERTFMEAAIALNKKYKNLIMVGGSDRVEDYTKILNKYNGTEYNYDTIKVVSAGERDPDAEGVSGLSGTKMREAALADDFDTFRKGVPNKLSDKDVKSLISDIRKGMGKE
jgi:hypothetical protein